MSALRPRRKPRQWKDKMKIKVNCWFTVKQNDKPFTPRKKSVQTKRNSFNLVISFSPNHFPACQNFLVFIGLKCFHFDAFNY